MLALALKTAGLFTVVQNMTLQRVSSESQNPVVMGFSQDPVDYSSVESHNSVTSATFPISESQYNSAIAQINTLKSDGTFYNGIDQNVCTTSAISVLNAAGIDTVGLGINQFAPILESGVIKGLDGSPDNQGAIVSEHFGSLAGLFGSESGLDKNVLGNLDVETGAAVPAGELGGTLYDAPTITANPLVGLFGQDVSSSSIGSLGINGGQVPTFTASGVDWALDNPAPASPVMPPSDFTQQSDPVHADIPCSPIRTRSVHANISCSPIRTRSVDANIPCSPIRTRSVHADLQPVPARSTGGLRSDAAGHSGCADIEPTRSVHADLLFAAARAGLLFGAAPASILLLQRLGAAAVTVTARSCST